MGRPSVLRFAEATKPPRTNRCLVSIFCAHEHRIQADMLHKRERYIIHYIYYILYNMYILYSVYIVNNIYYISSILAARNRVRASHLQRHPSTAAVRPYPCFSRGFHCVRPAKAAGAETANGGKTVRCSCCLAYAGNCGDGRPTSQSPTNHHEMRISQHLRVLCDSKEVLPPQAQQSPRDCISGRWVQLATVGRGRLLRAPLDP